MSLAEPKWYTNAHLLRRAFERVGPLRDFSRALACLSSSIGLVERESNARRILSTVRFHDISLYRSQTGCRVCLTSTRAVALLYRSSSSPVGTTRESTHLPHTFVCRSNKARKHVSPNTCRSSGPLAFKPSAGPGQAFQLPSLHVEVIDWFLGDRDPSEPAIAFGATSSVEEYRVKASPLECAESVHGMDMGTIAAKRAECLA